MNNPKNPTNWFHPILPNGAVWNEKAVRNARKRSIDHLALHHHITSKRKVRGITHGDVEKLKIDLARARAIALRNRRKRSDR